MTGRLEHLPCMDRLRELGQFSVKNRQLRGDHINVYQCLKETCQRMEPGSSLCCQAMGQETVLARLQGLFPQISNCSDRVGNMGHEGTAEIPQESPYALEAAKASPNCSQTILFFTAN